MTPLAAILRPNRIEDYIGQKHLVGQGAILRSLIEAKRIPSLILWGPPGVGKTTLANIIASMMEKSFFNLSAINSGVKDIREVIQVSRKSNGSILFIDEIHRFSKSQQDSLLAAVEEGIISLIGATTENPSFEIITPLLSRCQVFILKNLEEEDLLALLEKAIAYYKTLGKEVCIEETEALFRVSGGDARKLLNAIEIIVQDSDSNLKIRNENVMRIIQKNLSTYDKNGEMHYDLISAFIKSIRGSDPNGAVYWLARMIHAGEDPLFIARRMVISASEDIGLANPNAMLIANSCYSSVHYLGYPECRIPLSQTAIYLATSPKSNSAYIAINQALDKVEKTGDYPVPIHLRNAPTKLMKDIGYGADYLYSHNYAGNFTPQLYLPQALRGEIFYNPSENAKEKEIKKHLSQMWKDFYSYE